MIAPWPTIADLRKRCPLPTLIEKLQIEDAGESVDELELIGNVTGLQSFSERKKAWAEIAGWWANWWDNG